MHLKYTAAFVAAGAAVALPSQQEHRRDISSDDFHARTLATHPASYIISSGNLHEFLSAHAGEENVVAYLNDTRSWVPMTSAVLGDTADIRKRQGACYGYREWDARDAKSYFGAWEPASECDYTGNSDAEAHRDIQWSKTVSITNSANLGWGDIHGPLSASLGFSVTKSWTDGGSFGCTIPAHSVGQIWAQKYLGEADMWARACQSCGISGSSCFGDWSHKGSIIAPSDGSAPEKNRNLGCSTGNDNVKCG